MVHFSHVAVAAALVASSHALAHSSSSSICGVNQAGVCANQSQALTHQFAYYQSSPGFSTLSECRSACQESSKCKSYEFFYDAGNEFIGGSFYCYLYSVPVESYTVKTTCSGGGITPLEYFYDKACPAVAPATTGTAPTTCQSSYCYPNGEPLVSMYPDMLLSIFDVNYQTCTGHCKNTTMCKSVYFQYSVPSSMQPWGSKNSTSTVYNHMCVLLSQPVLNVLNTDMGGSVPLMDLPCPEGGANMGYVVQAPVCGGGTEPHSSV